MWHVGKHYTMLWLVSSKSILICALGISNYFWTLAVYTEVFFFSFLFFSFLFFSFLFFSFLRQAGGNFKNDWFPLSGIRESCCILFLEPNSGHEEDCNLYRGSEPGSPSVLCWTGRTKGIVQRLGFPSHRGGGRNRLSSPLSLSKGVSSQPGW